MKFPLLNCPEVVPSRPCPETAREKFPGENEQDKNGTPKQSNGEATSILDVRNPAQVEFSALEIYATHFIVSFLRFFAQSRR